MKEKIKGRRGITLIALVVTIIVLLILAGVAIATLTGDNGILNQSQQASLKTNKASELETVQLSVSGSYNDEGNLELSKLLNNLNNEVPAPKTIETAKEGNKDVFPVTVTAKHGKYEIDANGKIEKIIGIFLDKTLISLSDEKLTENLTATLTQDLSGTIEWSLENGTVNGDTASNGVVSITPLTGNSITVTNLGGGGSTTITATLSGTEYSQNCTVKIVSPTDIYVTLDTEGVLRFYRQKDNVTGTLYSNSNGPINLKNVDFTSDGNCPWYSNDRSKIVKVSFEEEIAPTSTQRWFNDCTNLTEIEHIERLNTDLVTNMGRMFRNCSNLERLDVSGFNTENVTDMNSMFVSCSKITQLNLSNFDTSNVKDMSYMFYGNSSVKTFDVSNFNTINAEDIKYMFGYCSNLRKIYVKDKWKNDSVTNGGNMFSGCGVLSGGKGTIYGAYYLSSYGSTSAKIDGGKTDPRFFYKY